MDKPVSLAACGAEHTVVCCPGMKKPGSDGGDGEDEGATAECYSWGWGDFGRLGHGDYVDAFLPKPMLVLRGLDIASIACGDNHCHAVTRGDGVVYSWGRNQNGQLGVGTRDDSTKPVQVEALRGIVVKMVACGAEHSVACTVDGSMYSWGWNCYGNLGLGDKLERLSPEKLDPLAAPSGEHDAANGGGTSASGGDIDTIDIVACGWRHSAAITVRGRLFTFGWSRYGQLGHGDNEERLRPHELSSLGKIKVVQAGWRHTVAIDSAGKLFSWGWNRFGQLGIGSTDDQNRPCPVAGPLANTSCTVANVCCGWRHTLALTDAGELFAFGRGVNGQLGNGTTEDAHIPQPVTPPADEKEAGDGKQQQNYVAASERYAVVPLAARDREGGLLDVPSVPCADAPPNGTGGGGSAGGAATTTVPEQKRARLEAQTQ